MYKQYNPNQLTLPMNIEVPIPEQHLARLITLARKAVNRKPKEKA